jgi:dTDP-4-dehydrorhamnose 3,5-epimerase-like enzyme
MIERDFLEDVGLDEMQKNVIATPILDVVIIEPEVFVDARRFLFEN